MFETETQALPENYFHVSVAAGLAEFVVCAADPDFAELRMREYCKDNPFLKIDPEAHFDSFTTVEEIPSEESLRYKRTQFACGVVRLMSLSEQNERPVRISDPHLQTPGQQRLFY